MNPNPSFASASTSESDSGIPLANATSAYGTIQYAPEESPNFDCPICMNTIKDSTIKIITSCSHSFCEKCVLRMQKGRLYFNHINCPMCRTRLCKLVPRPVPLERMPMKDVRKEHADIIRRIHGLEITIDTLPDRIQHYLYILKKLVENDMIAKAEIIVKRERAALLEEQIAKRGRPKKKTESTALPAAEGGPVPPESGPSVDHSNVGIPLDYVLF